MTVMMTVMMMICTLSGLIRLARLPILFVLPFSDECMSDIASHTRRVIMLSIDGQTF